MKYSYEYKRMCIELYRQGKWPETPEGIQSEDFRKMIRGWTRIEIHVGQKRYSTGIRIDLLTGKRKSPGLQRTSWPVCQMM